MVNKEHHLIPPFFADSKERPNHKSPITQSGSEVLAAIAMNKKDAKHWLMSSVCRLVTDSSITEERRTFSDLSHAETWF